MNIKNEDKQNIIKSENLNDNKIKDLKRELEEEKNKNKKLQDSINDLNNIINQLKQKNNIDIEKYNLEIKTYINKLEIMNNNIQNLSLENNNLKSEIKKANSQNNSDETLKLYKKIAELNEKIKNLNEKINRYPFILEKGEKMLSIIFASASMSYSIICKNTDTINKLEAELYKQYPEFSETNNYFLYKGTVVNKFKQFEELQLKNGDIIIINRNDN